MATADLASLNESSGSEEGDSSWQRHTSMRGAAARGLNLPPHLQRGAANMTGARQRSVAPAASLRRVAEPPRPPRRSMGAEERGGPRLPPLRPQRAGARGVAPTPRAVLHSARRSGEEEDMVATELYWADVEAAAAANALRARQRGEASSSRIREARGREGEEEVGEIRRGSPRHSEPARSYRPPHLSPIATPLPHLPSSSAAAAAATALASRSARGAAAAALRAAQLRGRAPLPSSSSASPTPPSPSFSRGSSAGSFNRSDALDTWSEAMESGILRGVDVASVRRAAARNAGSGGQGGGVLVRGGALPRAVRRSESGALLAAGRAALK